MSKTLPAPKFVTLNPALFDVTGRAAPVVVELPPKRLPTAVDRDLEWQRRYDERLRGREWADDSR